MKTLFHVMWATWVLTVSIAILILMKEKSFFKSYFRRRRRERTISQINDNFDRDLRDLLVQEESAEKERSIRNHPTTSQKRDEFSFNLEKQMNNEIIEKAFDKNKPKRGKVGNQGWRVDYYERYLKSQKDKYDDLD